MRLGSQGLQKLFSWGLPIHLYGRLGPLPGMGNNLKNLS